ncbi:MAG: hypothetical protein ACR2OX_13040, partial [Methyloligellaceae bacterium]
MSYLLILVLLLGFAPALIARSKGRRFLPWWIYGTVLGPVAMVHAMMMRDNKPETPGYRAGDQRAEADAPWPVFLWLTASLVIAAVAVFSYRMFVPAEFAGGSAPALATTGDPPPQKESRIVRQSPTRSLVPAGPKMAARNQASAV